MSEAWREVGDLQRKLAAQAAQITALREALTDVRKYLDRFPFAGAAVHLERIDAVLEKAVKPGPLDDDE